LVEGEGGGHSPDSNVVSQSVGVVVGVTDDLADGFALFRTFVGVQVVFSSNNGVSSNGCDGAVSSCDNPVGVDNGSSAVLSSITLDLDNGWEFPAGGLSASNDSVGVDLHGGEGHSGGHGQK